MVDHGDGHCDERGDDMDWRNILRVGRTYDIRKDVIRRQEEALSDPGDLLTVAEVNYVIKALRKFEAEYFQEFPLSDDQVKRFMFNIPRRVLVEHQWVVDNEMADVMSPLFLLYPFFTDEGGYGQGLILDIIFDEVGKHNDEIAGYINNFYKGRGRPNYE